VTCKSFRDSTALDGTELAGTEFNEGGLFPLGDAGLLHHRGVLFVNNRPTAQPDASGLNKPISQQARERFVDANAVAEHLSVTRRQVLAMTRSRIIPGHPIDPTAGRKQWRYKLSEVDSALSQPHNEARQPQDRKGR